MEERSTRSRRASSPGRRPSPSSTRRSRATATGRSTTWSRARPAFRSRRRKKLKLSGRAGDRREVPAVRQEAEAPHGQERPLRGLQRLPELHVHARTFRTPRRTSSTSTEIEKTTCDECGSPMKLRQSRTGSSFLGCTAYPKCRNVVNVAIAGGKAEARPDEPTGQMCPRCGHELVRRHGRYGAYVSCSNYPGLQVQAAQAHQGYGRAVSQGRRHHRGAARPLPARSTAA